MGVKVQTKKNDFPQMEKEFDSLNGKKVQVGVLAGEHKWLAGIHEYGCNIPVTDKMRAWLHAHGLHLKASTTVIHIPERSFLRSGYDECHEEAIEQAERAISTGLFDADEICEIVGKFLKDEIQNFATDFDNPQNHPFTKKQKGRDDPLDDGGSMIKGIMFRVE